MSENKRVQPTPVTALGMLRDACNEICSDYCKFLDEYLKAYSDEEEATERLAIEKCEYCPLVTMIGMIE